MLSSLTNFSLVDFFLINYSAFIFNFIYINLKITIVLSILFFLSGLIVGSFLNILIYKLPRKIPIFKPYSICYSCRHRVPTIFSFPIIYKTIFSKKECIECGARVSLKNILIEILNALLYLLVFLIFKISISTIIGILLSSILITISFIDWEFMIIPNIIVLPFTLIGIGLSVIKLHVEGNIVKWWLPLVFSAGAFVFMLIIHLIYPKGMGMGDVKLSLMLGAFLIKNVIAGLFIGFLIGSLAGLGLIITKKKKLKNLIPFGPFISIGGLISFFVGDFILRWYTGFI